MKLSEELPREIKYTDKWSSEKFHRNDLYDRQNSAVDYSPIPFSNLKEDFIDDGDSIVVFKKGTKQRQPGQPSAIGFLLQLLFGGFGSRPYLIIPTTTNKPLISTGIAVDATLINRTRRTTKYKIKGNCKNPPKKHDKEDELASGEED